MSLIRSGDNPFAVPPEDRDPGRRFRGRLAAPVTAWTSNTDGDDPAGLTVASVVVADAALATILGLIDPLSDFADAVANFGRFVVHVVPEHHHHLADQLAGRSPTALDRFDGLRWSSSPWGPVLEDLTTRAYCTVTDTSEVGESLLLRGSIDQLDLPDAPPEPLVYVRGFYRGVRPLLDAPPHFR